MNNFVIQASFSPARVADMLTTVFETTAWAKVTDVSCPEPQARDERVWLSHMRKRGHNPYALAPLLTKGHVTIVDHYDPSSSYYLNRKRIMDGLALFVNTPHYRDFVAQKDDAETADVFLQLCLFREVRYA